MLPGFKDSSDTYNTFTTPQSYSKKLETRCFGNVFYQLNAYYRLKLNVSEFYVLHYIEILSNCLLGLRIKKFDLY